MLKKLMSCIRQYKRDTILTPFLIIGEVIMEVVIPLLMSYLIDYGIDKGDMGNVVKIGLLLLLAAVISLAFGVFAGKTAANSSAGFAANLRRDMYYNVQNFSFSNIDKFSTSSLVTRLTTDVTNVQMSFQMIVRMAFRAPLMLIFAMVMSFSINVPLSFVFLACVPVLAIGLFFIMSKTHPIFERVFKKYDNLNRVVQENLHGIRVVKSFVREEHENAKFQESSKEIYKDFTKAEKQLAFNAPLMQFCVYACMIIVSWFGARMIIASNNDPAVGMTTGQLMSLMTYVMQILMSLMMVSMVFVMIVISRASAERIVEVLDEKSNLSNPENPICAIPDGSITFKDVVFSYSNNLERCSLKKVNLDIKSGETVGIIGGTGSSKTSLVQLIPRIYDVTEGGVSVGGHDVREYDIEALRNEVAMVLQKNVLFTGTISENLRWGDENATDEDIKRVCRLAQADSFIESFPDKYETHIEQGGTNVSGGQKQRLCIARALLKKPKILILDDSTSAVDTKTDSMIRDAFEKEIPDTTKIIIAQRISSVQNADKIIVMENGEINGVGTHDELLKTNEIYKEVYYSQVKGADDND